MTFTFILRLSNIVKIILQLIMFILVYAKDNFDRKNMKLIGYLGYGQI